MKMPKGVYNRKKSKRGRPKGSKNKKEFIVTTTSPHSFKVGDKVTFDKQLNETESAKIPWIADPNTFPETPSFLSRLEAATVVMKSVQLTDDEIMSIISHHHASKLHGSNNDELSNSIERLRYLDKRLNTTKEEKKETF